MDVKIQRKKLNFLFIRYLIKTFVHLLQTLILSTNRATGNIRRMSSLIQTTQPTNIKFFSMDEFSFHDLIKLTSFFTKPSII